MSNIYIEIIYIKIYLPTSNQQFPQSVNDTGFY